MSKYCSRAILSLTHQHAARVALKMESRLHVQFGRFFAIFFVGIVFTLIS